jgi:hypothetical protein
MPTSRRSSAWRRQPAIADRFERYVTRDYLGRALERALEQRSAALTASWRRDLLLIAVAQFFMLVGAVAALTALGA